MLGFFTSIVFKTTVKKYIDPNSGFQWSGGNKKRNEGRRENRQTPGSSGALGNGTLVDSREVDPLVTCLGGYGRTRAESERQTCPKSIVNIAKRRMRAMKRDKEDDAEHRRNRKNPDSEKR